MKVLLFGATGMVGQGVLRECLLDPAIELVETIGRAPSGVRHAKVRDVVHKDLFNYDGLDLSGFDACFFCLGVTSAGRSEAEYERLTYTLTVAAAEALAKVNPEMCFIYVSGVGTDSTEKGGTMWARVKGRTENAILRLFKNGYAFRPGVIQPMHGEISRTPAYRIIYAVAKPLVPLLLRLFPRHVLTTEMMGRAMINVAKSGFPKRVLEPPDIRECAN